MKTSAIIQVRMGSTRLPGKAMFKASGKPLLKHQIERSSYSKFVNEIIVATTTNKEDDPIIELCKTLAVKYYRGSEPDVLDRFYQCAINFNLEAIVRLTADDPLQEPEVMDVVIKKFLDSECDYASNTIKPTYPDGFDVEVFKFPALKSAWLNAKSPYEREHVTPFIKNNPDIFKLVSVEDSLDRSNLYWAVDTQKDYILVKDIIEHLDGVKPFFKYSHILDYLGRKTK